MNIQPFIKHRKYLHQHPEVSNHEKDTSKYIQKQLKTSCPDIEVHELGNKGILAMYTAPQKGAHVMFRCELDALPIQEQNKFKHQSKNKGVAHKCGHDGHMAIMLAFAAHVQENPPKKGTVSMLFQPAEENGEGAKSVMADKTFKKHCYPDYVYALHNVPGYEMNTIIVKPGTFTPSVISANIKLIGKTAHAAEPENGINPTYAIADMVERIKGIEVNDSNSNSFKIITPVHVKVGSPSYGVAAGVGELGLTFRTKTNSMMEKLKESFLNVLLDIVQKHELQYEIEWLQEFKSVKNDKNAVNMVKNAALNAGFNCLIKEQPFKWGEDFGLFTEKFSGAMFALGAGKNTPALHNPDYDFPDELILTGRNMFIQLLEAHQK